MLEQKKKKDIFFEFREKLNSSCELKCMCFKFRNQNDKGNSPMMRITDSRPHRNSNHEKDFSDSLHPMLTLDATEDL